MGDNSGFINVTINKIVVSLYLHLDSIFSNLYLCIQKLPFKWKSSKYQVIIICLTLTWDQTHYFYNGGEEAIHQVITIAHTCLVMKFSNF